MSRTFICTHCCEVYEGNVAVGAVTTCDRCGQRFNVLPFLDNQNTFWRRKVGILAEIFAGPKCPRCRCRGCRRLGSRDLGQRVVGGRWHNQWVEFWACDKCRVTWCYFDSGEA